NTDKATYSLFNETDGNNSSTYFASVITGAEYGIFEDIVLYFTPMALVDIEGRDYQTDTDVKEFLCFGIAKKNNLNELLQRAELLKLVDTIPLNQPKTIWKSDLQKISTENVLIYKSL